MPGTARMQRQQDEQQHRMAGDAGAGVLPRDQHQHQQQQLQRRRVLMQQQHQQSLLPPPFGANQMPPHQHQHQVPPPPSYLNMNVNLGLTMTMSDMESSIRAYHPLPHHLQHQQQQHQQQHQQHHHHQHQHQQMGPTPHDGGSAYWRAQAMGDPSTVAAYGKHSGLEIEFSDILSTASGGGGGGGGGSSAGMDVSSQRVGNPESGDMAMPVMGSPFEVSPFSDHMHIGSGGTVVGAMRPVYHLSSAPTHHGVRSRPSPSPPPPPPPSQLQQRGPAQPHRADAVPVAAVNSLVAVGGGDPGDPEPGYLRRSSSIVSSASGGGGGGGGGDSVASESGGGGGSSEYSQFLEAHEEPDLRQQKLDEKTEKCQFYNCPNRARVAQAYGKFCNRHVIVAPCGFPGCRNRAMANSSMCEKHLQEGKEALHEVLANRAQNVPVCRTFGCFKNDQGRGYCRGHEKLLMATGRLPKHVNKRRLNSAYTMCSYPGCNKHSQRHHLCRTHGNLIAKQAEEMHSRTTSGETYEEILARLQKDVRKCTQAGCTKNSQRDRLCTVHYYEKHNLQRDGSSSASSTTASGGGGAGADGSANGGTTEQMSDQHPVAAATAAAAAVVTCSVPDCSAQAGAKGMCKFHSGDGSSSGAKSPGVGSDSGVASGIRDVERTRCSVLGCVQALYASGMCLQHLKQQQQQVPSCGVAGRHTSAMPPFGDDRFCPSIESAGNARAADIESFYPSVAGNVYADASMSAYASVGPLSRQLSSGGVAAPSSQDENDARQRLFILNGKASEQQQGLPPHHPHHHHHQQQQQQPGRPFDSRVTRSGSSPCSNPICSRETFGREYCDSCQSMFSPLVVSVGDSLAGNSTVGGGSYVFSSTTQPEPEISPQAWSSAMVTQTKAAAPAGKGTSTCRASQCSASVADGGLCELHLRSFKDGALSVDELTLRSRQLYPPTERQQQQQASASARSPSSGKLRKYFCKLDGCDKQAQRKGFCKRHYRQQEGAERASTGASASASASASTGGSFAAPAPATTAAMAAVAIQRSAALSCRFPACLQPVGGRSAALCLVHVNASFCWQPGCENIVDGPQFCETHAFRRQCAYEGCTFAAVRDGGCATHALERRCSHVHCAKLSVGAGDRCRLHQISCIEEPCALCELHGLEYERRGIERRMGSASQQLVPGAVSRHANAENFQGGGNSEFADARASFRDARLI